jgi:hypothetical protein
MKLPALEKVVPMEMANPNIASLDRGLKQSEKIVCQFGMMRTMIAANNYKSKPIINY